MRLGRLKQESTARWASVAGSLAVSNMACAQRRGDLGFSRKARRQAAIDGRAVSKHDNDWDRAIRAAGTSGLEFPLPQVRKHILAKMVFKVLSSKRPSPVARGFCRERTRVEPIWLKHNL